jgi:cellulose synthase/poly-beta-1,6-N-acetylglucosamine synthase-like glycosyltransferase
MNGLSRGGNIGAEHADTPFVAFLDDDVLVHEDWLSRLLDPLADPAVIGTSFRSDFGKVRARSSPEDTGLCIRIAASVAGASYFLKRNYLEGRGTLEMARSLCRQETLQDERDYLKSGAIVAGIFAAEVGAASGMVSFSGWQSIK